MKSTRRLFAAILVLAMLLTNSGLSALADAVLNMPAALKIIDEEAFYGDTSIDKVVLSDKVKEIRARAFANSTLSEINLPDSLTFIAEDAFDGSDKVTVTAPAGSYAYQWAVDHDYIDGNALCVAVSCSADAAVPEETVTWTAEGTNGVAPYKYRFQLFCDGTQIATRAYSTTNTYTYKFTKAGTYYVIAQIKDEDGEIAETRSANIVVSLQALRVTGVTCDKSSLRTTDQATWTASATGGEQPYQYQFVLKKDTTTVATTDFSESATYSFTFEDDGSYTLEATVKDVQGADSTAFALPVAVALRPVEIKAITTESRSAVTESTISWTVETVAGKAPFTYDYDVKLDGVTKASIKGSTENTYTYNTEIAGSCVLSVTVKDAAGNETQQDSAAIPIITKTLTLDTIIAESEWVKAGDAIKWTATASGGVKPLRYAFDVYIDEEEQDGRAFNQYRFRCRYHCRQRLRQL